jgi:hypothetical protein
MRHEADAQQHQEQLDGEFEMDDEEECPATPPDDRRVNSFWTR